jgi:hypothetical protein
MQPSDLTHFTTDPKEKIKVHTCVDKKPFLCGFEDPRRVENGLIDLIQACVTRGFLSCHKRRATLSMPSGPR